MRAAVTESVGTMALLERPEPSEPGPHQVVVAPEAVGICGSDYHFFAGELSEAAGGSQFPRIQGHEIGARIVAIGPGAGQSSKSASAWRSGRCRRAGTAIRAAWAAPTRATPSS